MASGYQYRLPRFIQPIAERIVWQAPERFAVARNYSIDRNGGEVFVQNAGLADHGLVTPDLGMGCYRNACILREICGREYAVETNRLPAVQPAAAAHTPGRGGGAMTATRTDRHDAAGRARRQPADAVLPAILPSVSASCAASSRAVPGRGVVAMLALPVWVRLARHAYPLRLLIGQLVAGVLALACAAIDRQWLFWPVSLG